MWRGTCGPERAPCLPFCSGSLARFAGSPWPLCPTRWQASRCWVEPYDPTTGRFVGVPAAGPGAEGDPMSTAVPLPLPALSDVTLMSVFTWRQAKCNWVELYAHRDGAASSSPLPGLLPPPQVHGCTGPYRCLAGCHTGVRPHLAAGQVQLGRALRPP